MRGERGGEVWKGKVMFNGFESDFEIYKCNIHEFGLLGVTMEACIREWGQGRAIFNKLMYSHICV